MLIERPEAFTPVDEKCRSSARSSSTVFSNGKESWNNTAPLGSNDSFTFADMSTSKPKTPNVLACAAPLEIAKAGPPSRQRARCV
jgi:hypothetical protein